MQARDLCFRHALTAALALVAVLMPAGKALAQTPADFYRAEVVIVERLVNPSAVEEQMADMPVEAPLSGIRSLWVEDANGNRVSDIRLAGRNELHLNQAAARLQNSGNYRVLATAGWYQSFPQNYNGSPMRIAVGDWLDSAGQRAVEGHIEIDRQRFLHVNVHLNHWQDGEQPELITWIRETRRMRSEEIHFIDSPTIGVLVFFRRVEG